MTTTTAALQKVKKIHRNEVSIIDEPDVEVKTDFASQLAAVEQKIITVDGNLALAAKRVRYSGHENHMLPLMYEVLQLVQSVFNSMNIEASRIGIIKRKLVAPEPKMDHTREKLGNLIKLQFQVTAKLFLSVLKFAKDHIDDSYQIPYYLNMSRLTRAEMDMN